MRSLLKTTLSVALLTTTVSADWGTEPLGPVVETAAPGPAPIKRELASRYKATPADAGPFALFGEGKAECAIIIPASPSAEENAAAKLLQTTLEKMSGATFPIFHEYSVQLKDGAILAEKKTWPSAIWIGKTQQATAEKLNADDLEPGGFKRVRRPTGLFLIGNNGKSPSLPARGTYFAAVDLLERHLGVRWIWPGELGTIIPKTGQSPLSLPALNEQDEPALQQRIIRNSGIGDRARVGLKLLEKDESSYKTVLNQNAAWLGHQKTGKSVEYAYTHAFDNWYQKFGAEHPDWFSLRKDGSRKQVSDRPRLCKANPEVVAQAAKQVLRKYQENPLLGSASISPNDGSGDDGFCLCVECRKLDPKNGRPVRIGGSIDGKRYAVDYVSLSDRIATFYNRVAEEVAKTKPDAKLGAYAYSAYRDVPLNVTLHPSVVIGFVGFDYTNDRHRAEDRNRWDGWSQKSTNLFLRPNLLLGGYALPLVYPHRLAEDVKHCYQTGMMAADFDSLAGHWSTQGLNYYVLAKLLWDPSINVDEVIADYCKSGFGPAAPQIEEYFKLVEEAGHAAAGSIQAEIENQLREEEDDRKKVDRRKRAQTSYETAYFKAFSPELMNKLRETLSEAKAAANGDQEIIQRISFLSLGLDYSDLYRAQVQAEDVNEARKNFLTWYRTTFTENPLAVNSVTRLWRTAALYRKIK